MPDVSIAVSLQDKYSTKIKTMSQQSTSFNKELDLISTTIGKLEKNQESYLKELSKLTPELESAKQALKLAKNEYRDLGDELSATNLQKAQEEFDTLNMRVKTLRTETNSAQKSITGLASEANKLVSGGGGRGSGIGSVTSAVMSLGASQLIGDAVNQVASAAIGSAFGSTAGGAISSGLSMAAQGAILGSALGPAGTVVGGLVGGVAGVTTGASQIYETEDEYFKQYVQDNVNNINQEYDNKLSRGSSIAASREMDLISFDTLLEGDRDEAVGYLEQIKTMANSTPFLYDDLTSFSKTLLGYGISEQRILETLTDVGDTGAALGLGASDIGTLSVALGRMESSDKASLEYINLLTERGVGVVDWLAERDNISTGEVYDNISSGAYSGKEVAAFIADMMGQLYGGAMEEQSRTFTGLSSTLEGANQELENAMGEGYNEARKTGLNAQIEFLQGETGTDMQEAYSAMGAWEAELENMREQFIRESIQAAMASEEYAIAEAANDEAAKGAILKAAEIEGMNEFNATEGAQLAIEAEKTLISTVRESTAVQEEYWNAGYLLGDEFSKGRAAAMSQNFDATAGLERAASVNVDKSTVSNVNRAYSQWQGGSYVPSFATGIDYVPYNEYPAMLHEGERVLTASQARQEDRQSGAVSVLVTGNEFIVRNDSDITAIADELARMANLRNLSGVF